jgi:Sulfotransferase family
MQHSRPSRSAPLHVSDRLNGPIKGTWPNLFIVGAVKAGTTSLHRYLAQHPDVFMSPVKEPHFFSDVDPHRQGFDASSYEQLFARSRNEKVRGESSPLYLWDPSTAHRIRSACPDAKIIIMLRHPVIRAYSHYLMDVQQGRQKLAFAQAIQRELDRPHHLYVELGRYCVQVARYLAAFEDRVLVILSEEFFQDVRVYLKAVFGFLGVDDAYARSIDIGVHNEYRPPLNALGRAAQRFGIARSVARSIVPSPVRARLRRAVLAQKRPRIEAGVESLLQHAYREEPECLARLLGRDVPWELGAKRNER